jgi:hypothetical protein
MRLFDAKSWKSPIEIKAMLFTPHSHPTNSIYYNAAFVLKVVQERKQVELIDLFQAARQHAKMSFPIFILCLDWLYLIRAAELNAEGEVTLCT